MEIDINKLPLISYIGFVLQQELLNADIKKVKIVIEGNDKITGHSRKVEIERDI